MPHPDVGFLMKLTISTARDMGSYHPADLMLKPMLTRFLLLLTFPEVSNQGTICAVGSSVSIRLEHDQPMIRPQPGPRYD